MVSERDKQYIIKLRNKNFTYKQIKDKTGYSETTIAKIIKESQEGLSDKDIKRKEEIIMQLINSAKKCYANRECNKVTLICYVWEKCPVCKIYVPKLRNIVELLSNNGIKVEYSERDIKKDNIKEFKRCGCQGTPCVLVKDPITGKFKKIFEGEQKEIAAISMILGLPNPLYYGDVKESSKPKHLIKRSIK